MTVHTPIETRPGGLPPWAVGLTVFVFLVGGVYLALEPGRAEPGARHSGRERLRSPPAGLPTRPSARR